MISKVEKRNGEIVPFNKEKIEKAIYKAVTFTKEEDGEKAADVSDKVFDLLLRRFSSEETPHVEEIQDIVEEVLIMEGLVETARSYILYREKRREIRETVSEFDESTELIEKYIGEIDWQIKENANMTYSLQGLNQYTTSHISKKYWLNKIYPERVREAAKNQDFHIHDLNLLATYTFFGREVLPVKLSGEIKLVSFQDLYEFVDAREVLLNEKDQAFAKYPEDLRVLDRGGWTEVKRLVKKKKERKMRFLKSEQGRSVIVTDNHPFIIKEDEKGEEKEIRSQDVKKGEHLMESVNIPNLVEKEGIFQKDFVYVAEELLRSGVNEFFLEGLDRREFMEKWNGRTDVEGTVSVSNSANGMDNKLELTENFGYLVGMFIAEGSYDHERVVITTGEAKIIERIRRTCHEFGLRCYEGDKKEGSAKNISINSATFKLLFEKVFCIKGKSKNKNIPPNILSYNIDFAKGLVAGVIDGDGTVSPFDDSHKNSQILIRVSSRTMLEQLAVLLQIFGIVPRDRTEGLGSKREFNGRGIEQNYPLYGLSFSKRENVDIPSFKYRGGSVARKSWGADGYGWNKVLSNEETEIYEEWIYDITTESGTLVCNGVLVHNCCGWDLQDLLLRGFGGVSSKVESKPPKHLRPALGQIVNFFFTLQGECYSEDTQVLTKDGWKYFYEVSKKDKVFTLKNETGEVELQKPVKFYEFDHEGELYNFKSKKLDLLVTPNHNMIVDQYNPELLSENYKRKFVKAKDFNPSTHFIPKQAIWKGKKEEYFTLPAVQIIKYSGYTGRYRKEKLKEKEIPMSKWIPFFGFWLAEGCTSLQKRKRKDRNKPYYEYQIRITQNEGKNAEEFKRVLERLPFPYLTKKAGKKLEFCIWSKQLFSYLRRFGASGEKFVPEEIKGLEKNHLSSLLGWMMKGDGYEGNGNIEYYTKSEKLANDVQEVILKIGLTANIYRKNKGKFSWYKVCNSRSKHFRLSKESVKKVDYKGKVYCLEVPNHTLYVRRNGRACWCGNSAGAQAMSNFDTFLAPFIRKDNLSYKQVKQAVQEFAFNCMVPTRVGFQCLSEDTEILTKKGWKKHNEVRKGDIIKTFNTEKGVIEEKKIKKVFSREYEGKMYNLVNRVQDQLISPGHRVVRKKFNSEKYCLEEIEKTKTLKSPQAIPVGASNLNKEIGLSDEEIKLVAFVLSEGSLEKKGSWRKVMIYQSKKKNKEKYEEIISLLDILGVDYTLQKGSKSLGDTVIQIKFNAENSKKVLRLFDRDDNVKVVPERILEMSGRQSKVFIETYIKGDGHGNCKITVSDKKILEDLQRIVVNAGYGFTVASRRSSGAENKTLYTLRIIRHKETYIREIKEVNYKGIIWSVNTENETVVAKRKEKVFITGNTPFINISLDVKVPEFLKDQPVMIGGELQKETYGDFQKEMDLFNSAFYEVLMEGDAKGRVFTFPIPTISIAKDFDWDNKSLDKMWEATAKYGINYFSNFVQSDMNPEDFRSMCPLGGNEKVLIKSSRGRGVEYSRIRWIYEGNHSEKDYWIYSNGKFVKGKFNKFENQEMIRVTLFNNHKIEMSKNHLNFIMEDEESREKVLKGEELEEGMYLPYSLKSFEGKGGNRELGYFVGAYAGDGSFDGETSVIFSLNEDQKESVAKKLQDIAEKYFGAHSSLQKQNSGDSLLTLKIHSKAAVGFCKDFVKDEKREKQYSARLFGMSKDFRQGVVKGHYATDGGNRNRIYTSSHEMVETLNMLAATLGTTTAVYKDEREGRLEKGANYAVLFYQLNKEKLEDFWFKKNEKLWIKIKSIESISDSAAYCFEVENDEPVFTVGTTGILTHNCRLRLDNKELIKRGGGLFGSQPLTGSIGVVTINMPRIGYLSKTRKEFFGRLEEMMDIAKESLEIKRKVLDNFIEKGLYPYTRNYLSSVKKLRGSYFGNHFSTIGLIGMNETTLNFLGEDIGSKKGRAFALEVLNFMREKLVAYQEQTGYLYNLEATPGEGASFRQARVDREKYPDIITAGTKDAPYYTNSVHLPVNYTDDPFEALDLQDDLQQSFTGGTVLHLFLGERINTPEAAKNLVRKVFENYHLPYITLTPTFSICPKCGYLKGEQTYCPNCKIKAPKKVIKKFKE